MRFRSSLLMALLLIVSTPSFGQEGDLFDEVEHHFAENAGVRIHYVTAGAGPLVVMIHGFPDFWYTWRHQMAALASDYRVAAVDLRGYNRSDQPVGLGPPGEGTAFSGLLHRPVGHTVQRQDTNHWKPSDR